MNFNLVELIGRLLGYEKVTRIDHARPYFGAEWARSYPMLVVFGCLGCFVFAFLFYWKGQTRGSKLARTTLGLLRGLVLSLLLLILADPILELTLTSHPRPLLWVLIDGTDSMGIEDEYSTEEKLALLNAVGADDESDVSSSSSNTKNSEPNRKSNSESNSESNSDSNREPNQHNDENSKWTRMDYVKRFVSKEEENLLDKLSEKFRLKMFVFEGPDSVRALSLSDEETSSSDSEIQKEHLIDQLTTTGDVTAIGNAFEDLARRHVTSNLAGALVISDFAYNAGTSPDAAAIKLKVPVSTMGIGAQSARDLSVSLQAPPKMKKGETSTINVAVTQQEFAGSDVLVRLTARALDDSVTQSSYEIGERTLTLNQPVTMTEFPWEPPESGRFEFTVQVGERTGRLDDAGMPVLKPLEGEIVDQNNSDDREVTIIDDYMRLLFIEYEPTWEWRFVKEVFHRDKLVGMRGFRTFLRSADPDVKEHNELFLSSLTQPRKEFFKYDVIFLGDMPASTLSTSFCNMTKEFVSQFGGGLVVMAGPRFGPGELAKTPLADLLPVVVDPDAVMRDDVEFPLIPTLMAESYPFMQLGDTPDENAKAWKNLHRLPWYQPVKRLEPSASTILAQHPIEKCADGKTPQPLIAIRKYGRGEVIYLGFNEMWRLRKKYGEMYYRQFWGQMIHRLGLSHALGSQKRFVPRTDRQVYRSDERVLITVEAYNENFEPLTSQDLPDKTLLAEMVHPDPESPTGVTTESIHISELRPGLFEARIPVFEKGEYHIRVKDPITEELKEPIYFQVLHETVERREAVRNIAVQQKIAHVTQGKSYDLTNANQFLTDFNPPRLTENHMEILTLWDTWLTFGLVIGLLFVEWMMRKFVNLA